MRNSQQTQKHSRPTRATKGDCRGPTGAVPSHPVPSPLSTMGKPAKWAWVRSTLSPRLTVKITAPSPLASSTVHQSWGCWEPWHRGVENQLNQTWVSNCRTNASSAFFSSARESLVFFCVYFLKKGDWKRVLKVKEKTLLKSGKRWPMQQLAEGVGETLGQFRASFSPWNALKLGVRHILWPLTLWFTSPGNYLCASPPWPLPPKDL